MRILITNMINIWYIISIIKDLSKERYNTSLYNTLSKAFNSI